VSGIPKPTQPAGLQIYEAPTFATPLPYDQIAGQALLNPDYSNSPTSGMSGPGVLDLSMVEWNIPAWDTVPGFPVGSMNDPFPNKKTGV
jgi:hypothetical protein